MSPIAPPWFFLESYAADCQVASSFYRGDNHLYTVGLEPVTWSLEIVSPDHDHLATVTYFSMLHALFILTLSVQLEKTNESAVAKANPRTRITWMYLLSWKNFYN